MTCFQLTILLFESCVCKFYVAHFREEHRTSSHDTEKSKYSQRFDKNRRAEKIGLLITSLPSPEILKVSEYSEKLTLFHFPPRLHSNVPSTKSKT